MSSATTRAVSFVTYHCQKTLINRCTSNRSKLIKSRSHQPRQKFSMFACCKISYALPKAVAEQLFCRRARGSLVRSLAPLKDLPVKTDNSLAAHIIAVPNNEKPIWIALEKYKEIYGDMLVPSSFSIPVDCHDWPKETRGLRLGKVVGNIRSGRSYSAMRDELISIGFDYKTPRKECRNMKVGLLRYKEIHGDLLVPTAYCVPVEDDLWPKQTWGLKLGRAVSLIRGGRIYVSLRDELISMGFDYKRQRKEYGATCVMIALARYKQLHGDLSVPHTFSVPVDCDIWPKQTWGMKLGCVVTNIRKGFSYKSMTEELRSMGFDFKYTKKNYALEIEKLGLL
jgi:hypothetical protein